MKSKTILPTSILFIVITSCTSLFSQVRTTYCDPTFINDCIFHRSETITLDSINWVLGSSDCNISDYTSMRTTLTRGIPMPMTVVDSFYCGTGVWIDFNNDGMFDSLTENMYHSYS